MTMRVAGMDLAKTKKRAGFRSGRYTRRKAGLNHGIAWRTGGSVAPAHAAGKRFGVLAVAITHREVPCGGDLIVDRTEEGPLVEVTYVAILRAEVSGKTAPFAAEMRTDEPSPVVFTLVIVNVKVARRV